MKLLKPFIDCIYATGCFLRYIDITLIAEALGAAFIYMQAAADQTVVRFATE